tara:strand:- start:149 stop:1207 length:1059 start_codon:yes stop_codon:yes gene_type:complete
MDDFTVSSLHESKNEWCARLLTTLTPCVITGLNSIFNESWRLCSENDEEDKYLMTFQNLITQIPKWSDTTIEDEVKRIVETSGCNYINDLITCVHIIHLKLLTSVRVGNQQKKIDLNIPKLNTFIHKCYIHSARKVYTNVYLFDKFTNPLTKQKNNRELEILVQESILTTIRDSLPIEHILKNYIDETVEEDVVEEVLEEKIEVKPEEEKKEEEKKEEKKEEEKKEEKKEEEIITGGNNTTEEEKENVFMKIVTDDKEEDKSNLISFNNTDSILTPEDKKEEIEAPKDVDFLEELNKKRELESNFNNDDDDDENEKLVISDDVQLNALDFSTIENPGNNKPDIELDNIEILG